MPIFHEKLFWLHLLFVPLNCYIFLQHTEFWLILVLSERSFVTIECFIRQHHGQSWFTSTSKDAFSEYPSFINKINLPKVKESLDGNYNFRSGDI